MNRPCSFTDAAASSPEASSRSAITTVVPSAARRPTVASPMPLAPPVTRPSKRCIYQFLSITHPAVIMQLFPVVREQLHDHGGEGAMWR